MVVDLFYYMLQKSSTRFEFLNIDMADSAVHDHDDEDFQTGDAGASAT